MKMSSRRGSIWINKAAVPRVERERQLVGPGEAVTGDLLHPAEYFTLCQGPPQIGH